MADEREVEQVDSSPLMFSGEVVPENKPDRLKLDFAGLIVGKSLKVPFELAHEPSLRVRVSRENAKKDGRHYRMIRHGYPIFCFEIGCVKSAIDFNSPDFDPLKLPNPDEVNPE